MGEESLRIVARQDIQDTLAAFEELYELLVLPSRADTATRAARPAGLRERAASGGAGGVPVLAASYAIADDALAFSGADTPETSTHERLTASGTGIG